MKPKTAQLGRLLLRLIDNLPLRLLLAQTIHVNRGDFWQGLLRVGSRANNSLVDRSTRVLFLLLINGLVSQQVHDCELRVGDRLLLDDVEASAVPPTLHLVLAVLVLRQVNRGMAILENRA